MPVWDDIITDLDKEMYRQAGFRVDQSAGTKGFGARPALLIIDVLYSFIGDKDEPIGESVKRFPLSSGDRGWAAARNIAKVLSKAREKKIPVIYSKGERDLPRKWVDRNPISTNAWTSELANVIVKEIEPKPGEAVISKFAASIFHQTPLVNLLAQMQVDTVLVTGGVTSGCVRASVVDGSSFGYTVGVIEECLFDRGLVSHKVNLFDMNSKYASVINLAQAIDYLNKLPAKA